MCGWLGWLGWYTYNLLLWQVHCVFRGVWSGSGLVACSCQWGLCRHGGLSQVKSYMGVWLGGGHRISESEQWHGCGFCLLAGALVFGINLVVGFFAHCICVLFPLFCRGSYFYIMVVGLYTCFVQYYVLCY